MNTTTFIILFFGIWVLFGIRSEVRQMNMNLENIANIQQTAYNIQEK